jgi:hypothetical protein
MQGRAIADVAAEMNTTPNAVSLFIGRVINRLRQEFAGLLPDHLGFGQNDQAEEQNK